MRRNSGSSLSISGAYTTSPGTPEYGDYRLNKGWSSERLPLPSNGSRRHVSSTALMPFNSGRTLPSKWDDAERWITSPFSGYDSFKNSVARPPKSKSGPLGPTGVVYLGPSYSPANVGRNYMANSPLTTGVFVADGLSVHYESEVDARSSASLYDENNITRSASVPGLSDLLDQTYVPASQDGGGKEEEGEVSCRDMATQMSPQDDVRDVQVDKGTTTARPRHCKNQMEVTNVEICYSSKLKREEAKINAWENLQKAKAEAAIRKLEMKLEKKRSASMDKIGNKLRAAQMKAQAMRNKTPTTSPHKGIISYRLYLRICSLSSCFFCTNTA